MKIEKTPSGSYRVRKMFDGKKYSITFDHKPTQKEITKAFNDKMSKKISYADMRLSDAFIEYFKSRENVSSPSTLKAYKSYYRAYSEHFLSLMLSDVTQNDIQKEINILSLEHSPKTVRNYHGLISAVMGTFRPEFRISTSLPQKRKNEQYIPNKDDVQMLVKSFEGSEYEIAIKLACYGLRRSEILALQLDDISADNVVTINKAMVENENHEFVIKTTKTVSSTRCIQIDQALADLIREKGYIYRLRPNSISNAMKKRCKELGIEQYTLHKLRHWFASYLLIDKNVNPKIVQELGGWSTDHVMKSIYLHNLDKKRNDEATRMIADDLFF